MQECPGYLFSNVFGIMLVNASRYLSAMVPIADQIKNQFSGWFETELVLAMEIR